MKLQSLLSTTLVMVLVFPVKAQDLSPQQSALNMIADFAEKICKSAPLEGQSTNVQLSGAAKADLSDFLKKIANLNIEGAAKYGTDKYQGVLQKDLAITIKNAQDCRLEIWNDLKDKLDFGVNPQSTEPSISTLPTSYTLVGTWENDDGAVYAAVADPNKSGEFEFEQIQPPKEYDTLWKATLAGRKVEIDVFVLPSGSHQEHMELELSLDNKRMVGLSYPGGASPDYPPSSIHFRRKN